MRYLYWLKVLWYTFYRRIIWVIRLRKAIAKREKLRNTVYNYHLQRNIILKRLWERNPIWIGNGWELDGGFHSSEKGFVKFKYVSKDQYKEALTLWLVLDDDSNEDTYSHLYNTTIINRERWSFLPRYIIDKIKLDNSLADKVNKKLYGNAFDLGEKRAIKPLYGFWSVFFWTLRNTSYNYNYKYNQICDKHKFFQFIIFGRLFGWDYDGFLIINGKQIQFYSWECGKKI